MEKLERINKYLSEAGVCSRREVDELIETGRVEVNQEPARIGMQIDTTKDKVYVDGQLVKPENPEANAISVEALAQKNQPWWVEHNAEKEAKLEALKLNPKSKLLRKGRKERKKVTSIKKTGGQQATSAKTTSAKKSLSQIKSEVAHVAAIKTRGHSAEDKHAKNIALQAAHKELKAKLAKREENHKAKSFSEAISKLDNPAHTLKERRVEGVNPKAAALRKPQARKPRRK